MKFDCFWFLKYKIFSILTKNIHLYWFTVSSFFFKYTALLYKSLIFPYFVKFKTNNYAESYWYLYANKSVSLFKRFVK